jgi:DNA mismatch endonuclease, patch repair protein
MSLIRSRGNKATEIKFLRLLRMHRLSGWRRHLLIPLASRTQALQTARRPTVRPDFVFRRERVVIFVDGCFWHGCPVHALAPGTNRAFWRNKLAENRGRDRRVNRLLRSRNWRVLRFWEHQLDEGDRLMARVRSVLGRNHPAKN